MKFKQLFKGASFKSFFIGICVVWLLSSCSNSEDQSEQVDSDNEELVTVNEQPIDFDHSDSKTDDNTLAESFLTITPVSHTDAEHTSSSLTSTTERPLTSTTDGQLTLDMIPALNDVVRIFPPLANDPVDKSDFDASLFDYLTISICETEFATQCTDGLQLVPGITPSDIRLQKSQYHVIWKPSSSLVGRALSLQFYVAGLELRNFPYVTKNRSAVSIRYAIDNHPRIRSRILAEQGFTGSEIASALLTEFNASGAVVALMLYAENFDPEVVASSLRDIYKATAQQTADWLFVADIPVTFTAEALRLGYLTSALTTAEILRIVGYNANQVYTALKASFNAGIHQGEEILISAGFSEDDAFSAVFDDLLAWYDSLIQQFGPVVYLHPDERYEMSSVEWFMGRAELYYELDGETYIYNSSIAQGNNPDKNVTPENLPLVMAELRELDITKTWFGTPDPNKPADPTYKSQGNQASAKAYVHAQRIKNLGYTDMQFWLWYPYNGPGSFHSKIKLRTLVTGIFDTAYTLEDGLDQPADYGNTAPLGEHTSDWENVVLRFDNETGALLKVFMSAHGHYSPYDPNNGDISFADGNHVEVFSALNGHALFNKEGSNGNIEKKIDEAPLEFFFKLSATAETLNWCKRSERKLNAHQDYEIIAIDNRYLDSDRTQVADSWAKYTGNWGPDVDFGLTDSEKKQVILNIGGDAISDLKDATWGLAAEGCAAIAAVVASPCLFIGPGYAGCYAGAYAGCYGGLVAGVHIAIPDLLDAYAADALDGAFPNQKGTGKPSPGVRGIEWDYLGLIKESPAFAFVRFERSENEPGVIEVEVVVSSHYKKKSQFGDHSPAGIQPYLIDVDRVQLEIDGITYDISDSLSSSTTDNDGITQSIYSYHWDTYRIENGDHELHVKVLDPSGKIYEYRWDRVTVPVCNQCLLAGPLAVDQEQITEGGSVVLTGSFSTSSSSAASVSVNWGDGTNELIENQSGNQQLSLTHIYADNGDNIPIILTVSEDGVSNQASTTISVLNAAPLIEQINLPQVPVALNGLSANVMATIGFSDPGLLDTHDISWHWGDGLDSVTTGQATSPAMESHTYQQAGVYQVSASISDQDGGVTEAQADLYVVTFDSTNSIIVGTGEIKNEVNIDPGDLNTTVELSAQFGFYLSAIFDGSTDFSFKYRVGDLTFSSQTLIQHDMQNGISFEGMGKFSDADLSPASHRFVVQVTAGITDTFQLTVFGLDEQGEEITFLKTTGNPTVTEGDIALP